MSRNLLLKSLFGLIALLSLIFFSDSVSAQISHGGKPWTFNTAKGGHSSFINVEYDEIVLKSPDVEPLIAEDLANASKDLPLRVGVSIDADISMENAGTWTDLPMGARLWTLKVKVPGAKALTLGFEDFYLAEGSKLFFYNENRKQVLGAFTSENNLENRTFAIEQVQGEVVYIEYYEPAYKKSGSAGKTTFHIFDVGYFYREFTDLKPYKDTQTRVQESESCEVDINCTPVGDDWQDEKRGVAQITLKSGGEWYVCTGSLINNTNSDGTPYFLTAFHCGEDNTTTAEFNQWIFKFKYEAPAAQASGNGTTITNEPSSARSITGCTKKASGDISGGSDFLLLLLNTTPTAAYEPYYNGWNRSTTAPSNGVGIHHPAGDIKKISTYTTSQSGSYTGSATGAHWRLQWRQNANGFGVTEGGSSGSPLFDSNGFVVGTLTGGSSYCTATAGYDYYGKISYHWQSNGNTNATQLKPWLDPSNSNVTTCPGYDPFANQPPEPDFAASSTTILEGGSVDFYNYTMNNPVSYSWSFPGATPSSSTAQEPTGITYNTPGSYNVTLAATNANGTNSVTKNGYINVLSATGTYCDTISQFGGEAAVYSLTNNTGAYAGYLAGTNSYNMTSWAEKFTAYSPYNKVSGFRFFPAVANNGTNCDVTFNLWSVANDAPSEVIASKTISMANVISAMNSTGYIDVDFGAVYDIPAEGFAVGFDRPGDPSSRDTLATYSNSEDGEYSTAYVNYGGWVEYASLFGSTGLQYPMFPFVCYDGSVAPTANFISDTRQIDVGESVSFYDISAGNVTSRTWTFEGGSPSTSTAVNPVVTYSAPGSYQVSLTVTNANGSNTKTVDAYINVFNPNASSGSFSLDFEACGDFQVDNFHPWTTYDGDGAATYSSSGFDFLNEEYTGAFIAFNASSTSPAASGWEAHGGDRCGICFASTTPPNNDWLISAPLTLCSNASISFWAKSITENYGKERFNVLLSTTNNNISSFTTKLSGNTYVEAPTTWTLYEYSLSSYAGQTVYIAIQCVSNDAYAFMIDDIEITGDCNSAPSADFMADNTTAEVGSTISFTDLSTNMPTSWSWTFNGGTPATSTVQNPRVTYNTPGTYAVSLTVTNAQGTDTETKTGYITITPHSEVLVEWNFPSSGADATADDGIEANLSKTLSVGGGVGTITYTTDGASTLCANASGWRNGSNTKYWTVNFTTTGYESIKFWSKQSGVATNGQSPKNFKVQYSLNNSTWTDVTGATVTCAADWTTGVLNEISLPEACNNQATVYLRWIMTSTNAITGTVGRTSYSYIDDIIVKGIPMITTPEAAFTADATSVCPGTTVTFTDQSTNNPTSWSWNFGDGGTSTDQNPTHTYATAGNYTVTLVAGNANGIDTETKNNYITVNANPTVSVAAPQAYCAGETAAINATVSGATTYAWSGPNGFTASTQNASIANATASNAGTYTITVTSAASCSATASANLTINAAPSLTASNGGPYCEGATIALSATGNGGTSYSWSGPDGFTSTQRNPSIANADADNAGTYTVTLTNNTTGCSTSATTNVTVNALPTLNPSNDGPYCAGSAIRLNANGANGTVYAWSGPNFTSNVANPTIANSAASNAGTYNVTLTNSVTGCSVEASTVVVVNAVPTVIASNGGAYCAGQSIALSAASNATSFAWSGPNGYTSAEQNPTIANATTSNGGTYTVTATNANGCSAASSTVVSVNAAPTANASNGGPYCVGQAVALQTTATGTYSWSGPNGFTSTQQNPTIANSTLATAGTYTLVVSNANGCTANATTEVVVNDSPTASVSNEGPYCEGASIALTAVVTNAASYSWSGPNGFSSNVQNPTINNATTANAGIYTLVATTGECSAEATTTVVVNAAPVANATNNGPYCEGATIYLQTTATGTYAWSGPNGFTSTQQNPTIDNAVTTNGGTYSLVVTGANGCVANASTDVVVNATPTLTASNGGAYCAGETISLSATSDAASFAWNGPNGFTSALQNPTIANATANNAGLYTIVATASNGCVANASTTVVVNANPTADASNTGAYCEGATIELHTTATGTYAWSGPNGFTSNLQNPTIANATLANGGEYTLVVSNANGCNAEASTTVVVNANPTIELGATQTVCSGATAVLDAGAGLTYHWSTGASTQTIVATAGDYYVTVYNANECSATDNISVANYPQTTLTTSSTAESHNNALDGTATVTPNGTAPFAYMWSNNGNTATIGGLAGGNYNVTVTDGNGCETTAIVNVATMNTPPVADFSVNNTTVCLGAEVAFTDLSTNTPTQWAWNFGDGQTSNLQNPTHTYVAAGSYNVSLTVTNQDGSDTKQVASYVVVNAVPTANATNAGAYCAGETIELSVESDIATEYQWVGPMGFSSTLQNPTRANATTNHTGTYSVTVTTANGCLAVATTDVTVNANPVANATNNGPYCEGAAIALQTTATGTYAWSGPNGFVSNEQNPTIGNATTENAGEYMLTVSNVSGCSAQASTVVVVNATPTLTTSNDGAYCAGETISLSAISDATSFAWSGPNGYTSALQNPTIANATPNNSGTYTVVATSANGCSVEASTNVVVYANPVASITNNSGTTVLNCTTTSIQLVANGGTSYSWNGVAGNAEYTVTAAGVYTVVVTNEGNCTDEASITITSDGNNPMVSIDGGLTYCEGSTISFTATSDVPATFAWEGPNGFTANTASISIPNSTTNNSGAYVVTATPSNGCAVNSSANVVVNANPSVAISNNGPVCEGGQVTFTASSNETLSYSWSGPNGFASTEASPVISAATLANAGTYTLEVENVATGCVNTFQTELVVNANPMVSLGDDVAVCANVEAVLNATAGFVSYTWNGVAGSQTYTATVDGIYTVVVTDNHGCTASDMVSVTHYELPVLALTSTNETGTGQHDGTAMVEITSGVAPYSILWSTNATTAQITGLTNGQYSVVVTDDNGCEVNGSVNVGLTNTPPVAAFEASATSGCAPLTVNFTDASTNYPQSWTWYFGETTSNEQNPTFEFTEPGTYTVMLMVANPDGTNVATSVIRVYANPTINLGDDLTACVGSAVTVNAAAGFAAYAWSNGATESTVEVTEAGSYSVVVTDDHGCTATDDVAVTFNPLPVIELGDDVNVCSNASAEINAGEGYASYAWSTGDATQSIMVSAAGEYAVTVTNEFACSASDAVNVAVLQAPTISLDDVTACTNQEVMLTIETDDFVLWLDEVEGNTYTETYPYAGEYQVWVTVSNEYCETTDTVTVTVELCNGVEEMSVMEIQLYPNPVRDIATFTVSGYEGNVSYSVVDLSGREMTFETVSVAGEAVHTVDVSNFVPGMYILRVTTGTEVHNLKFTKE